jgi:hypothetical protein
MVQKYFFYNRFRGINAGTRSRRFYPRLCRKVWAKASLRGNARVKRGYLRGVRCTSSIRVVFFLRMSLSSTSILLYSTQEFSNWLMAGVKSCVSFVPDFSIDISLRRHWPLCTRVCFVQCTVGMSTPTVNRLPYWFLVIFEHSLTNILKVVVA